MNSSSIRDRSFQSLFRVASDAMVLVDDSHRCLAMNRAATTVLGLTQAQLLHQSLQPILPNLPDALASEAVSGALDQTPQPLMWTDRLQVPGQPARSVVCRIIPKILPQRHLVMVQLQSSPTVNAIASEVNLSPPLAPTEFQLQQLQHVTAELRRSERRFRSVFEQTFQLTSLLSPDGVVVRDNQTALEFCQISERDSVGRFFWELDCWSQNPDNQERLRRAIAQAAGGETVRYETEIYNPQRQPIPIDFSLKPLRNDAGEIELLMAEGRDLSDLKRLETAILESETKFVALFQANPDPIILSRLNDGCLLEVNPSFCRMTGYEREEAIGRTSLDLQLWPAPASRDAMLAHLQAEGCLRNYETIFRMKSGEHRLGLMSAQILELEGQTCLLSVVRDITERQRTQSALLLNEHQQQHLLSAIPDLLLHVRRDGTCLHCQFPTGSQVGNFVPIRSHLSEVLPPDLLQHELLLIQNVLETGDIQILEHRLQKQGRWCDEEVRIVPMTDDEVLIVVRDITERKRAEALLQRQATEERVLQAIMQHVRRSLDINDVLNTAVQEVQATLKASQVLIFRTGTRVLGDGARAGDVVARSGLSAYDALSQLPLNGSSEGGSGAATDSSAQMHYAPIVQPDSQGTMRVWGLLIVHWNELPADLVDAEVDRVLQRIADQLAIAIQQAELYQQLRSLNSNLERQVQDRTQQMRRSLEAEALLKDITQRLRDSLDETRILDAAIQELADNLGIQFGNIAVYPDTDNSLVSSFRDIDIEIASEYPGQLPHLAGLVLSAQDYPAFQRQLLNNISFQVTLALNHAPQHPLTVLLCPIADERETLLGDILLIRRADQYFDEMELDLVQQVANQCAIAIRQARFYQAAQAQVTELARLNRLKDDFLSTVSHELRTPMATIKMATEMLEIRLRAANILNQPPDSSPIDRYFAMLKEACDRETTLINDLLDLTRLDADTDPPNPETLALHPWLTEILESFQAQLQKRQHQLQARVDEALTLSIDPGYLRRIVVELLTNACKYTPDGGQISLVAEEQPGRVQLTVSNSGVDLPAEECDRIFEQFYRVPSNDRWQHSGTGLGLALVKKLTAKLGGTIRAESRDNTLSFVLTFLAS